MQKGDICFITDDKHCQSPYVVVSADFISSCHTNIILIPISWHVEKETRFSISIKILNKTGIALCNQVFTVPRHMINPNIFGRVSDLEIKQINEGLITVFDL